MVNTYLQCLQSLWMLFGTIVQKVFDINLKFRYQRVRNEEMKKKYTIIISSFKIERVKVALFFFQICCYLIRKIEIFLKYFLGQKFPDSAVHCAIGLWRKD